jgi:hypothetical protein
MAFKMKRCKTVSATTTAFTLALLKAVNTARIQYGQVLTLVIIAISTVLKEASPLLNASPAFGAWGVINQYGPQYKGGTYGSIIALV